MLTDLLARRRPELRPLPAWAWIALATLVLRLWGLAHGLPDAPHPDEPMIVRRALRFGGGDLNPHFFYYPSFSMYLFFAADGMFYILGLLTGRFTGTESFALSFVRDPTAIYLLARFLSAAADAGTAALTAAVGARLFSPAAGAAAGLLWAVFPPALDYAQLAKPDAAAVFLGLAAFAVLSRGRGWRSSLAAGLLWGLAVSTKYNAAILAPASLFWMASSPGGSSSRGRRAAAFLAAGGAGFFLGTPYALLDAPAFWHDFREQTAIMAAGVTGLGEAPRGWLIYLKALLSPGGSPVLGFMTVTGLILMWRSPSRATRTSCLVLGTFFLALAPSRIASPHYLLPALPFLFWLAGGGVAILARRLGRPAGAILLLCAAAPLLWGTAEHLWLVGHADSRLLARAWIERNIPAGSGVLTDASGPQLWMERGQIQNLLARAGQTGNVKADLFALQLKAHPGGGYRVYLTEQPVMVTPPDLLKKSREVQDLLPIDRGVAAVRSMGVGYVVTAGERQGFRDPEMRKRYPAQADFYDELDRSARRVAHVPAGPWIRPGPTVSVYDLAAPP